MSRGVCIVLNRDLKLSDFAWNQEEIKKMMDCVKSKTPCLIHGSVGIGKSSSVYAVARELGMSIIEYNGSDQRNKDSLQDLLSRVQMRTLGKGVIYFVDEVDNVNDWSTLQKIVSQSRSSLVLACNEIWKVDDNVKNRCTTIKYLEPPLLQVVNQVRLIANREGIKEPQYQNVNADFRGSLLSSLYGGSKHSYQTIFDKVEGLMKRGIVPDDISDEYLIWCLDNSSSAFFGRSLYEFIQLLCQVDMLPSTLTVDKWRMVGDFCSLKAKSSLVVRYPNYFTRVKNLSRAKRKNEKS